MHKLLRFLVFGVLFPLLSAREELTADECSLTDNTSSYFNPMGDFRQTMVSNELDQFCSSVGVDCILGIIRQAPGSAGNLSDSQRAALNLIAWKCGGMIRADLLNDAKLNNLIFGISSTSVWSMATFNGFSKLKSIKFMNANQRSAIRESHVRQFPLLFAELTAPEILQVNNGDFENFTQEEFSCISQSTFLELLKSRICVKFGQVLTIPFKFLHLIDAQCIKDLERREAPFSSCSLSMFLELSAEAIKALSRRHTQSLMASEETMGELQRAGWCKHLDSFYQLPSAMYQYISRECFSEAKTPFKGFEIVGSLADFGRFMEIMTFDQCKSISPFIVGRSFLNWLHPIFPAENGASLCPVLLNSITPELFRRVGKLKMISPENAYQVNLIVLKEFAVDDPECDFYYQRLVSGNVGESYQEHLILSSVIKKEKNGSEYLTQSEDAKLHDYQQSLMVKKTEKVAPRNEEVPFQEDERNISMRDPLIVFGQEELNPVEKGLKYDAIRFCSQQKSLVDIIQYLPLVTFECLENIQRLDLVRLTDKQVYEIIRILNRAKSFDILSYEDWIRIQGTENGCKMINSLSWLNSLHWSSITIECYKTFLLQGRIGDGKNLRRNIARHIKPEIFASLDSLGKETTESLGLSQQQIYIYVNKNGKNSVISRAISISSTCFLAILLLFFCHQQ